MEKKKLISIITPVFNEENNINNYYSRITDVIDQVSNKYDFEIIFNDNCSNDNTYELIEKLALSDQRIRLFRFSKNYGYQKSIWFGYINSKGHAAIELDVDLQDPPEMIGEMLKYWEKGHKIVYGIRKTRKEGILINLSRKFFYRLIRFSSDSDIPNDAGDFMLIDQDVILQLKKLNLYDPYLRGIIFSYGFSRKGIEYNRNARISGESKFSLFGLFNFATGAFVSSSLLPLRLASYLGLFATIISFILLTFFIVEKLFFDSTAEKGVTAILILILVSIALNSIFIGILGEYVGKIYKQLSSINLIPLVESSVENKKKIDNFDK